MKLRHALTSQYMKNTVAVSIILLLGSSAFAQRPTDPALLVPENAPELEYVLAPRAVNLPDDVTMGAPASVATR